MIKTAFASLLFVCSILIANAGFGQDQAAKDDQILKDYLAKNHIKATRTASGLYYRVIKEGTGEKAKPGQKVVMNYIGKLMDGTKFDGNIDEQFNPAPGRQPFPFTLGQHQVIAGWDEGVALLNKGERATLYIPSGLGYGPNGRGPIPPNGIMIFDVELLSMN